jgi:hypothetical protein
LRQVRIQAISPFSVNLGRFFESEDWKNPPRELKMPTCPNLRQRCGRTYRIPHDPDTGSHRDQPAGFTQLR